jgi:hypothetical protein
MIKKTLKFEDFDGNEVTETHYFHMSKKELVDMITQGEVDGVSLVTQLEIIIAAEDGAQIISIFTDIIGKAYGQRVEGNASKFHKSDKIRDEFMGSLAYDALLDDLLTNPTSAAEFVNNMVPKDLANLPEMQAAMKQAQDGSGVRTIEDVDLTRGSIGVHVGNPALPDVPPLPRDDQSGLKNPRDTRGQLLPWAFRHPSDDELTAMTKHQLLDASRRKMSSTWEPPGE